MSQARNRTTGNTLFTLTAFLAGKQAFLFGRVNRLASLTQIGELARRLQLPWLT